MTPEISAFLLTLFAGLATGIGSALAFTKKASTPNFLSVSLGFSAGVMIYVSFMEILPKAQEALTAQLTEKTATWSAVGAFFLGILVIAIIDRFVPEFTNPHEFPNSTKFQGIPGTNNVRYQYGKTVNSYAPNPMQAQKLLRMGIFTALALAIHNFPEGFATFLAGLQDAQLAIPIAVAIAIHNIPEGIAVAIPVYYATGSKKKSFWLSFASGLSEPLGALIGWLLLSSFLSETVFGIVFAAVAGVMVYISLDELLPTAEEYGNHHQAIYGLITGMAVMALSLLLFL